MDTFKILTKQNIEDEHICCAIGDKKHQLGVKDKKEWLKQRIDEGHVFCKLDVRGKVFIEYAPLETAWVPVEGNDYMYIYCLWVAGSYKGKGYGDSLMKYCIEDAKRQHKAGICVLTSKKKMPFLSDRRFFEAYGFQLVEEYNGYQLYALSFDETKPSFCTSVQAFQTKETGISIYYTHQCPFTTYSVNEVQAVCKEYDIDLHLHELTYVEDAKQVPCIMNSFALFYNGEFVTTHLMNANQFKKRFASIIK